LVLFGHIAHLQKNSEHVFPIYVYPFIYTLHKCTIILT
jgi:hypothetical protein